jgi:hypothetical protein
MPSLARSLQSAASVTSSIKEYSWDRLTPVQDAARSSDDRSAEARSIVARLRTGILADEIAQPLQQALKRAEDEAFRWAVTPPAPLPPPPPPPPPNRGGRAHICSEADLRAAVAEMEAFREQHDGATVVVEWRVEE